MNYHGKCEHCGGEIYVEDEDQSWICTGCSCIWRLDGQLVSRGDECLALAALPSQTDG